MRYQFTTCTKIIILNVWSKIIFILPILWKVFPCQQFSLKKSYCLDKRNFGICNRVSWQAPDKKSRPSPYSSVPNSYILPAQNFGLFILVRRVYCEHSPSNPNTAHQECFNLLNVSSSSNYSFSNTQLSLVSPEWPLASSVWTIYNTVKQAS